MRIGLLIAAALTTSFAACSTQPVSNEAATPVPAARVLDGSLLAPRANATAVTVKRDSGPTGSGCSARLYVDAKPIADIRSSEKIVLYLTEGDYILSTDMPSPICGGRMTEIAASVKPQKPMSFRIGMSGNGELSILATAF